MLKWMTSVIPWDRPRRRLGPYPTAGAAGEGRLELELHVVAEALDLAPVAAAAVEHPQAELGEVGHEDVGQVDQRRAAAHGVERDDRQGHQHRVGVVLLDRLVERRAGGRLVADVPPDDLDPVANPAEDQDAVVVADGHAGLGHAAGDRDRGQAAAD